MSHSVVHRSGIGAGRTARRVIVTATAAVANVLAWVGSQYADVDYVVQTPIGARQVTLFLVIVATTISGLPQTR